MRRLLIVVVVLASGGWAFARSKPSGAATIAPARVPVPQSVIVPSLPCFSGDAYRVQVLYVRPPSATDRLSIFKSMFEATVRRMDNVLNASAAETSNRSQHVRWVTDPPLPDGTCVPTITPVVLKTNGAASTFNNLIADIQSQGYKRSDRKYFVFADAVVGGGPLVTDGPIADATTDPTPGRNSNNGKPTVAGIVALADVRAWFGGWGQAHELMHSLGAVQSGAPHFYFGHVNDSYDELDLGTLTNPTECAYPHQYRYDCGHDDYYSAATSLPVWNTADSAFLTPKTATQSPPANDSFAHAQLLSGPKGAIYSTSNTGATKESGEPAFGGVGHSIWYRWTASSTGVPVQFATYDQADTDFHPALAVYEDTNGTLAGLVLKGSYASPGSSPTFVASVTFQPQAGKTYRIVIDGTDPKLGFGNVSFKWAYLTTNPDFDGDGKTDIAVFRPSTATWYIRSSSTGSTTATVWGANGDIPVPGDYDGDGKTDLAVYRPSDGTWRIRYSSGPGAVITWGGPADIPVPGDWNNDTKTDVAVYHPSTGTWSFHDVASPQATVVGQAGDIPIPESSTSGTHPGLFRPSTAFWYGSYNLSWGARGDIPAPGDWSGFDGFFEPAVFRPSNGTWYRWYYNDAIALGKAGDIPLALPWAIQRFFF